MNTPTDANVAKLYEWIDAHQDEIVSALQGVLRIRSLKAAPTPNAPYGLACREALDYTLQLCDGLGFRTKDFDGHAGHAEFGEGAAYVAALGHLDVVPEGDGWSYPPYGATLDGGYLYARGSSDDKGPTYAALFGAKALLDSGLPLQRRVRLIFGCDEESGFGCVHHYFDEVKEERPLMGFTPDSSFPLIFAEKGIANLIFEKPLPTSDSALKVASAAGGLRPNMVPELAEAHLTGTPEALAEAHKTLKKFWDKNVSVAALENEIVVRAGGKSAHGSHPTAGDNAVARLSKALAELPLADNDAWVGWLADAVDPTGGYLGIAGADDVAGPLTSNLGILETANGVARVTFNIRYPVTWTASDLIEKVKPMCERDGWTLAETHDQPPLYVPLDKEPVSTLLRVYQEATGDLTSKPGTMGGGTYARATPNVVAYGAAFPGGSDGPAHETDERIAVSTLVNAAKIYAHALYEMAK